MAGDPTQLTALIAIILSIISIVLWAFKEGVSLPLEYRESESAVKKRKEIDTSLRDEVEVKLDEFSKRLQEDQTDREAELQTLEELGWLAHIANWTSATLLEGMTHEMSLAIRNFSAGVFGLIATVLFAFFLVDLSTIFGVIYVLVLVLIDLVPFYTAIKQVLNNFFLRKSFLKLHENPNLECCQDLVDEALRRDLWHVPPQGE